MLNDYKDIRDRIPEPPRWYDEYGVPRYCEFAPGETSNVYAGEAVYFEIACQACGHRFLVAETSGSGDRLANAIRSGDLSYKDPPNIGCCPGGPTMMSETLRVLEYWRRDQSTNFAWRRDRAVEEAYVAEQRED